MAYPTSVFLVCRKRKHVATSDTSGSEADTSRSPKKKRPAVIGSGSEDSDARDGKGSADGDEKEQTGSSNHSSYLAYLDSAEIDAGM
jgi:hypothetical protein